jgi:Xaa-Pro aminopeptidase
MQESHRKLKKVVEHLGRRDIRGLIIYSNGSCDVLSPSYLHYFSEVRPLGQNNAAIISKTGAAVLLVEPAWDVVRAQRKSWIGDVRGTNDFLRDLKAIMRDLRVTGPVGVIGAKQMTESIYSEIEKEVDIHLVDTIFDDIAKEKDRKEIAFASKAGSIADAGFRAFLEQSRIGIRECELLAEVEFAMRSAGANENFNLISSGKHNYAMHAPTDRRLMAGDIVIGEITASCEGQFVQVCRTVFLGKPSTLLSDKYAMLAKALDEALGQVKSGVPASSISVAINRIISDAGYAKYCYPPYMRARGHGFGSATAAPGTVIDDETKVNFEKNQVVVVHPNQYLPETGYLACGETVLVTDTGMERLSKSDSKLYVKEV